MTGLGLRQHCRLLILSCPSPSLLFSWVLHKPQPAFEGQSQESLPVTAWVTPHLPHKVFPAVRKYGSTSASKRLEEQQIAKGHADKEMDWDSETFVRFLLYPTPTRRCSVVLLTSQLSASSRELKNLEAGLCYVFATCSTLQCPGPTQSCQFGQERLRIAAMHFSSVMVPQNTGARFSSHSETATVWYGRMCLNSSANNHFSTNSVDMKQAGIKTYRFQELSKGWTSAQGRKQCSCKREDQATIPQQQSKRTELHARKTGHRAPSEASNSDGQGSVWTANSKHMCK